MSISSELDILQSLIKDFGVSKTLSAEQALRIIQERYTIFKDEKTCDELCNVFKDVRLSDYPKIFLTFSQIIHSFLFQEILTNAGHFRSVNEPKSGAIYFGGQKHMTTEPQFIGVSANQIDEELNKCFEVFSLGLSPIETAIRFYQRFVQIHPFYDANGRIGRLIITIYLRLNNIYIDWKAFADSSDIIKRLNNCHRRYEKKDEFEKYFQFLLQSFRKFIIEIPPENVPNHTS